MSCQRGFLTNDNDVCFYQETPGKWHVSRLQSHTKTGWTSDHPVDSCVCVTEDDRALTPWQQDEDTQIGTWIWHIVPFHIQSAAYVTWWVNRSGRVGQDWCKRVCWQAEISGPQMSYARFLRCTFAPHNVRLDLLSENFFVLQELLPAHRGRVSLSPRKRHGRVS